MNETTFNGDIAELMAACELVRRGYVVSRPLTNGACYDILVDTKHQIKKVQIKKASRTKTGAVRVKLTSSKYHRGRTSVSYFGRVDCVIGVECESQSFFVIAGSDLKLHEISIRDTPTKNGQEARTRQSKAHELDSYFPFLVRGAGFEPATPCV